MPIPLPNIEKLGPSLDIAQMNDGIRHCGSFDGLREKIEDLYHACGSGENLSAYSH